jgi:hypothetical protein
MQIRRTARTCSPAAFVRAIQFSVSECTPLDRTRSVQLWTDTPASPDRVQPRPIGYAVSGKARVCSVRRPARSAGCSMSTSGRCGSGFLESNRGPGAQRTVRIKVFSPTTRPILAGGGRRAARGQQVRSSQGPGASVVRADLKQSSAEEGAAARGVRFARSFYIDNAGRVGNSIAKFSGELCRASGTRRAPCRLTIPEGGGAGAATIVVLVNAFVFRKDWRRGQSCAYE